MGVKMGKKKKKTVIETIFNFICSVFCAIPLFSELHPVFLQEWHEENMNIASMVERPSRNGKVCGSIPDSVTFSCCWFKKKKLFNL